MPKRTLFGVQRNGRYASSWNKRGKQTPNEHTKRRDANGLLLPPYPQTKTAPRMAAAVAPASAAHEEDGDNVCDDEDTDEVEDEDEDV